MKIYISNLFSIENKGDAAILLVLLKQLKKICPKADLVIETADWPFQPPRENVHMVSSALYQIVYKEKTLGRRMNNLLRFYLAFLFWFILSFFSKRIADIFFPTSLKPVYQQIEESDVVIATGGGYLRGKKGFGDFVILSLHAVSYLVAMRLGKPLLLFSQSIGPFTNLLSRTFAKLVLGYADCIIAREGVTVSILKELGIPSSHIVQSIDSAFLFSTTQKTTMKNYLIHKGFNNSSTKVGITVKRCLDTQKQASFESEIAKFITYLQDQSNVQVFLVPQTTSPLHNDDDRVVQNRILNHLETPRDVIVLNRNYTATQIKGIYENLDFLIGTRMHSAIFALTGYVPVIALEYEHKTRGIMRDLGLEEWVLPVGEVTATKLISLYKNVAHQKQSYGQKLKLVLPIYIRKGTQTLSSFKYYLENDLAYYRKNKSVPSVSPSEIIRRSVSMS